MVAYLAMGIIRRFLVIRIAWRMGFGDPGPPVYTSFYCLSFLPLSFVPPLFAWLRPSRILSPSPLSTAHNLVCLTVALAALEELTGRFLPLAHFHPLFLTLACLWHPHRVRIRTRRPPLSVDFVLANTSVRTYVFIPRLAFGMGF
jgi:hypothetical protein